MNGHCDALSATGAPASAAIRKEPMNSCPTHPEGSPYPAGIPESPVPPIRPVRPAQPRRRVRRLARLLVRLALLAIVGSVAAVALWRFAPPPLSGVMAQRWLEARLQPLDPGPEQNLPVEAAAKDQMLPQRRVQTLPNP